MSTTPDINLHSFNGPEFDYRFVDWTDRAINPGPEIADTLKCSTGLKHFTLRVGTVVSGREDGLDINNLCHDLDIEAKRWIFPKRPSAGFTIKGGSYSVRIAGEVDGDPLVDIGNASDQSHVWVTDVRLGLRRIDGKPIRVRVLAGDFPVEEPGSGPYEYVFPSNVRWSPLRRLIVKAHLELRRHGIG